MPVNQSTSWFRVDFISVAPRSPPTAPDPTVCMLKLPRSQHGRLTITKNCVEAQIQDETWVREVRKSDWEKLEFAVCNRRGHIRGPAGETKACPGDEVRKEARKVLSPRRRPRWGLCKCLNSKWLRHISRDRGTLRWYFAILLWTK